MKEFIAYLIKNLVDQPDAVDVQVLDGQQGTIVEIRVSGFWIRYSFKPVRSFNLLTS